MKKFIIGFFSSFFIFLTLWISGFVLQIFFESPSPVPSLPYDTLEYVEYQGELFGEHIAPILLITISFLLSIFFMSWYHRLKKRKKSIIKKEEVQDPFILYLRSFIDDKLTEKIISPSQDIRTEEEIFVDVLKDIAPVYAIGDPSDKKMPLGANRIYVPDEHWKSTVTDLTNRAEVIVLRLGKTNSFWWEVDMALKNIPLEKILFIIPVSDSLDSFKILNQYLLEHGIDTKDIHIKPSKKRKGSISSILYFDKDGTSHSKELIIHKFTGFFISYDNILRNALQDFRKKYGLSTPKIKYRKARVLFILILFIIILLHLMFFLRLQSLYYNSY